MIDISSFLYRELYFYLEFFWYYLTPIIPIIIWYFCGRDPQVKEREVTAWYDPPKHSDSTYFTPAEAQVLINEGLSIDGFVGTLVGLAQKKAVLITGEGRDLRITYKQPGMSVLSDEENFLLKELFRSEPELSPSSAHWRPAYEAFSSRTMNTMLARKYLPYNPQVIVITCVIMGFALLRSINILLGLSLFFMGLFMGRKSTLGKQQSVMIQSYRNFLRSQKHHWEYQAYTNMLHDKHLPYAVALGIEKTYVKRFREVREKVYQTEKERRPEETIRLLGEYVTSFFTNIKKSFPKY